MATAVRPTSLLARNTAHFELPPQWASMRKAAQQERETGVRVIHFEKGDFQGDEFAPSPHITEACQKALRDGHVRYVPGPGLPELREAIAAELTARGRPTSVDEVLVTLGAKHALMQTILTLVDPGDELMFPNPGYPPDEFWTAYAGGVIRHVRMRGPRFELDLEELERLLSPRTKLLIINTPQRPSGELVGRLPEIAELCLRAGVCVLSDEIFSRIVYPPASHESITEIDAIRDTSIHIDTFSKSYVMTGFRIGWLVAAPEIVRACDIFQQNSVTNVPAFVQLAALAALTGPQGSVDAMVDRLRRKRDRCVAALDAMPGVVCRTPPGSFYVFPDISGTGMTAQELADHLVEEYAVGVVAGTAFGSAGEGHVRITYAAPDDVIDEGLDRLARAFDRLAA
jgi:aspartate/methionine/tyrosine aminotransferase